jgi:hypothetical protein
VDRDKEVRTVASAIAVRSSRLTKWSASRVSTTLGSGKVRARAWRTRNARLLLRRACSGPAHPSAQRGLARARSYESSRGRLGEVEHDAPRRVRLGGQLTAPKLRGRSNASVLRRQMRLQLMAAKRFVRDRAHRQRSRSLHRRVRSITRVIDRRFDITASSRSDAAGGFASSPHASSSAATLASGRRAQRRPRGEDLSVPSRKTRPTDSTWS